MRTPLDDVPITFPPGAYADVRLERVASCRVQIRDGELHDVVRRTEIGAFLRVRRGGRWICGVTTDLDDLSDQLADLARRGPPDDADAPTPPPHRDRVLRFADGVDQAPLDRKLALLRAPLGALERPSVRTWTASWLDRHQLRRFVSSAGADVVHDAQIAGCRYDFVVSDGAETLRESCTFGADDLDGLDVAPTRVAEHLARCERFVADAQPVTPGAYRVILSPMAAGVFAHESFGHKSEADFMLGDPGMLEAWKLGARVGADGLSIADDGALPGAGYVPYDDEGQPARRTWLLRDGVLTGRLHSHPTATALSEPLTGNARAMSFRFEPIVRMTNTWIEPGPHTREALFADVDDGLFIETIKHGSGMSRFTLAPSLAWRIRGGVVAEPVRVAVVTGSVFETLGLVDGLSDTVEMPVLPFGGCGKMEQWPLPVGMGGPYLRVARMDVA